MFKSLKIFFIVIIALTLLRCSGTTNPVGSSIPSAPQFAVKSLTFPTDLQNSSNVDVVGLLTNIDELCNFSQAGCCFACPENAEGAESYYDDANWTYKWQCEQLFNELQIQTVGNRHNWALYWDGAKDSENFTRWRRMEAVQSFDKNEGHVILFQENSTKTECKWVWTKFNNGSYQFERYEYVPDEVKQVLLLHADSSGEFTIYVMNKGILSKTKYYKWYVNGNGEWWEYENGTEVKHSVWG